MNNKLKQGIFNNWFQIFYSIPKSSRSVVDWFSCPSRRIAPGGTQWMNSLAGWPLLYHSQSPMLSHLHSSQPSQLLLVIRPYRSSHWSPEINFYMNARVSCVCMNYDENLDNLSIVGTWVDRTCQYLCSRRWLYRKWTSGLLDDHIFRCMNTCDSYSILALNKYL